MLQSYKLGNILQFNYFGEMSPDTKSSYKYYNVAEFLQCILQFLMEKEKCLFFLSDFLLLSDYPTQSPTEFGIQLVQTEMCCKYKKEL